MAPALPRILAGSAGAISISNLQSFGIHAGAATRTAADSFEAMYAEAAAGAMSETAKDSFDAVRILQSASPEKIAPDNGAVYPNGPFGNAPAAFPRGSERQRENLS